MSKQFTFDKKNGQKVLKAFLYSVASAFLVAVIAFLPELSFPEGSYLVVLVPLVNALAVAALQYFKAQE